MLVKEEEEEEGREEGEKKERRFPKYGNDDVAGMDSATTSLLLSPLSLTTEERRWTWPAHTLTRMRAVSMNGRAKARGESNKR